MSKANSSKSKRPRTTLQWNFSLPVVFLVIGILLIVASFLPLGEFVAQSQWSAEDSAAYDKVSREYKTSAYQPAARRGLSPQEWEAQREKMRARMQALQEKLDTAKSQPQRWSRYLLTGGVLLAVAGLFANIIQQG